MTVSMKIQPTCIRYPVVVRPDKCTDGTFAYLAEIPDLPGCMSHGVTLAEALQNIEEAKSAYLETLTERGLDIPLPKPEPAYTAVVWEIIPARKPTRSPAA